MRLLTKRFKTVSKFSLVLLIFGFITTTEAGLGFGDSSKFLLSDWNSDYNKNSHYDKWGSESVTLPTRFDNVIRKYHLEMHGIKENQEERNVLIAHVEPPIAIVLIVVGIVTLALILYFIIKCCLKNDVNASETRRQSPKPNIHHTNNRYQQPPTPDVEPSGIFDRPRFTTFRGDNTATPHHYLTCNIEDHTDSASLYVNTNDGLSAQLSSSHRSSTSSPCLDSVDGFNTRILIWHNNDAYDLPPSYDEVIVSKNATGGYGEGSNSKSSEGKRSYDYDTEAGSCDYNKDSFGCNRDIQTCDSGGSASTSNDYCEKDGTGYDCSRETHTSIHTYDSGGSSNTYDTAEADTGGDYD